MEEKKFVKFKQDELGIKEYVKNSLGKGRISDVAIEYTPVGEKIIIATNRPGLVIGKRGEKIEELTTVLRKRFNLDNPHIDIKEISNEALDAQLVADSIAIQLERKGSLKFKIIAYKALDSIMKAGALGTELALSGKLPSERAKTWRFAQGYLKKTGDPSKVVNKAIAQARTQMGVIGIKVKILPPDAHIHDQIKINDSVLQAINRNKIEEAEKQQVKKKPKKKGDNN
ncbi:MAG: 30S ribosomal protein S3 [Nanoarchaeota archaeon]